MSTIRTYRNAQAYLMPHFQGDSPGPGGTDSHTQAVASHDEETPCECKALSPLLVLHAPIALVIEPLRDTQLETFDGYWQFSRAWA